LKKLKTILKYKYIIFLFILFIALLRTNLQCKSKYSIDNNEFIGTIIEYDYKDTYISFTIKSKEKIKCNYYLKDNEIIKLNYGDKIYLKGTLNTPNKNSIPNTFNYQKYLNNNNIFYILNVDKIYKIKTNNNFFYKIKNNIQKRIDNIDNTGYLNTFILGNKNYIDDNIYDTYKLNGILHIFSISGMHISILASIILYILNIFKSSNKNIIIVIIFLSFYLVLTNYQASIVRSIVFYIILKIFKLLKIKIKTSDALLLSIAIILLIYPKFIYNIGFLYSSIISYTLVICSNYFNKGYIVNTFLISFISFIISLPITVNINYSVNLFSIIINLIFVPIISFILYPLSILTFIFPIFYNFFKIFINIIEYFSINLSNINIFNITIPKLNVVIITIYYSIIYLCLNKNIKYIFLLVILILVIKNINVLDNNIYTYFIDVGQGDMTLIKYKNETTIIDTGNVPNNINYNYMDNVLLYIKSIGIININTLIITHGDMDHIGNAKYLVNNFKVEKVIFNCGEFNELEQELIKVLDKKKIQYYSCIKELNLDGNKLYFLNNKDYDNENDNSSVIYTELNSHKFLFMGDAGVEVEEDLIEKYNLQDIDVLKVGHHGSKTSSSKEFINEINLKYSVISVGKYNRYGHPNKEVLDNLNKSKIYRTDQDGSIMFKIKNNKLKIETCVP